MIYNLSTIYLDHSINPLFDFIEYRFSVINHNMYKISGYNLTTLHCNQYHNIMDYMINASDVQIHVVPTRIDEANTRLDFQIYANNAEVTGPSLNESYNNLEITSAYGIYNLDTDKMTIHIPYSVALQQLVQ